MGQSTETARVVILGEEYSVSGDVSADTTRMVAEYVSRKMSETEGKIPGREKHKTAVLSAMNITGELFDSRSRCEAHEKELSLYDEKTLELARRINSVLNT